MFLLNKIIFILNLIAALLLLGSYLSPIISPQVFWPVSLLGLAYFVLLMVNVVFIVYWLVQFKLHLFISLGAIIVGFSHIGKYVQLSGSGESSDKKIKVISFNVQNFDERHTGNKYSDFFEFIKTESPDVLCMQDFNRWVGITAETSTFDELKKAMGGKVYYTFKDEKTSDLLIMSKYPIVKRKGISFSNFRTTNGAVWADINIKGDTVRIFNVHFQSFLISNMKLEGFDESGKAIENSKNIIKRLRNGFQRRVPQVDTILQEVGQTKRKFILCGDFNDTPMSYTYGRMTEKMKDAFIECGSGMGATYTGPYPSFRIDYIMHHPDLSVYSYNRNGTFGSDHRAIEAEINIK